MMMVMSSSFELIYYFDSASYQEAVEHSKLAQEYFVAEKNRTLLSVNGRLLIRLNKRQRKKEIMNQHKFRRCQWN